MKNRQIVFALSLLIVTSLNVRATQTVQGHVPRATSGLTPTGRLASSNDLTLAISLPLRNRPALTNFLQRLHDPSAPEYHHYLTLEQFAAQFGPTSADYEAVTAFARSQGLEVTSTRPSKALLDVRGTVEMIEKAFHLTMRTYQHPAAKRVFYAPDSEPSFELATPILHISGLDNYTLPRPMNLRFNSAANPSGMPMANGSGPGGNYMGNDFRAAYLPGVPLNGAGQSVGLVEFDGFFPADVTAYQMLAGLPSVPLKTILLNGFNGQPGPANDEVSLDIDMAMSMAPGLSSVIVYEGIYPDDILDRMATDNLAKQLSASWTYDIDAASDQYFLQFAAQGQSFFNATGDNDAWVGEPAPPTDDPNLISVGGTTLTTTGPGGSWSAETVWNWDIEFGTNYDGVGGSGGISTEYPIPAWQEGLATTANQGSSTMRNIPDVAMVADNVFLIANNGQAGWVGGTSCATPLWAAFTALVNQQAMSVGKEPIGFLNPAVYAIGKGANYTNCFHDITTGNNTWSQSPSNYFAVNGYDLCTGWGTPTGSNLINILAPPDSLQISPAAGFISGGGVGGPFSPGSAAYLLTNAGSETLNWSAGSSVSWLTITPDGGTLAGGGSVPMHVSLNGAATACSLGIHAGEVFLTNLTDDAVQSRPVSLSVISPPMITAQPSSLDVLGGQTVVISASAAGGLPLAWQWQLNGVDLTNSGRIFGSSGVQAGDGNIYGSITTSLTISDANFQDSGSYTLVVSNAAGTAASARAVLGVAPSGPVVVTEPISETNLAGSTAQFSVAVLGTQPLAFQWQFDGTNLSDGGEVSGSTTDVLFLNPVSGKDIGQYTVVITNSLGTVTSAPAALSVVAVPAGVDLVQNGGFETGDFTGWGESGNFVDCAVASGYPAVHSQQYGALLGPPGALAYVSQSLPTVAGQSYLVSCWVNSDGATPNEFLVAWNGQALLDETNLAQTGWTNLQIYATATDTNAVLELGFRDDNGYLGLDDISVGPMISADGPPIVVSEPAGITVTTNGGAAVLTAGVVGAQPLNYQWQFDGTNFLPNGSNVLVLTSLTTNLAGIYSLIVSNRFGSANSSNAVVLIEPGTGNLITFDDLSFNGGVPNGYQSLQWSNFYYLDGASEPGSGYAAGEVSSPNVAYNGYGTPAMISNAAPFDLLSAYLTAAWNNALEVEAIGYSNQTVLYDTTYDLSPTRATLAIFNFVGVTAVKFNSTGGSPFPGYGGDGAEFVVDNISIIYPPTPPFITGQPESQIVAVGDSAGFAISAVGSSPLYYLWQRNGLPIKGATNSTYTASDLQLTDNGAVYACQVSNAYGITISSNSALTVASFELVKNGGFEAGNFTNWGAGGNFASCFVTTSDPYVYSGLFGAQLGPVSPPGYLSQTLATAPGQTYRIGCWLYCDGGAPNDFSVNWGGLSLFSQTNIAGVGWTNLVFTAMATATSTVLQFGFYDDPSYLGLDNITVTPVPFLSPPLQSVREINNDIQFAWQAASGVGYQLQFTTNLARGKWVNIGTPIIGSGDSAIALDTISATGSRFYRLIVVP